MYKRKDKKKKWRMKESIKRDRSGHDVLMMMVVVQHIVIYRCIILVCVCV